jgi:matrixin
MRARLPVRMVPLVIAAILLATSAGGSLRAAGPAPLVTGRPAPASAGSASLDNPCKESAYTFDGSRWNRAYRWYFSARTRPSGLKVRAVESALKRAVANVTHSDNNCRLADRVSASAAYRGRTRARPNVGGDSTCGKPDGKSEVGFGKLAPGQLGLTCYWTRNDHSVEADVKLNKANYSWYVKQPSSCLKQWSIEAVATHEFGHAFGLNHVSELTDGALTMSPLILACQQQEVTLGLGDVRGLRALY